jgi:hypothetical protein
MTTFVCVLELIAASIRGNLFDFTATGRTFVQAALGTENRSRLAAFLSECNFAAFAAQDHVAATVDRRAAAQDGAFVQPAVGALRDSFFAALVAPLGLAAQPTERDFGIRVMCVRNTDVFCLATAGNH